MTKYTTSPEALERIEAETLRRASADERISIREVLESVRVGEHLQVNNNDAPDIARKLLAKYPHLRGRIETRALGVRGPNKKPVNDNAAHEDVALVAQLLADCNVRISSVTLSHDGGETTVGLNPLRIISSK